MKQSRRTRPLPAAAVKATARSWLKRISAPARPLMIAAALLQTSGYLAYAAFAFGFSCAVVAILEDQRASPFLLAAVVIAGLARAGFSALAEHFGAKAGAIAVQSARESALAEYAGIRKLALGTRGAGEVVSTIVDRCQNVHGYAARWTPGLAAALAAPVLLLIVVFTQSAAGGLLLSAGAPLLPIFLWLTGSETAARARAQQDSLSLLADIFNDRLKAVGAIKAHNAVDREAARIAGAAETLRRKTMSVLRIAFLSTATLEFFSTISIALVAVYIGFQLLGEFPFPTGESVTLREGLVVLMIAPEFYAPIRRLGALHHDRSNAIAAAAELAAPAPPSPAAPPAVMSAGRSAPAISFISARLARGEADAAVGPFSFEAPAGKTTVITGPSGCGKTSALLALLGVADIVGGEIRVDGEKLAPRMRVSRRLAYIGQTSWLAAATVHENIALADPDAADDAIAAAAEAAGAPPLDRRLGRGGAGLSGGERQRVALARALLKDADIMLFDEPTAHLDPASEAAFLATLRRAAAGRTLLIASHHESVKAIADRLVELQRRS